MHAALLLLPLLAPALGHTIPRHRAHNQNLDDRALRDAAIDLATLDKRAYPKAHFGFPPSKADLESSPGFKRNLVRRKIKRSCKPKQAALSAPSASAPASASANSTIGGGLAVLPATSAGTMSSAAITSASAVSSTAAASSSASSAVAAPSASSGSDANGLMHSLFPVGRGLASWSTAADQSGSISVDSALKPLQAGRLPATGTAPDGSSALVASFPAGTVKLASGQGFSFYTEGNTNGVSVTGAKEVLFSYSVYFQEGFQFVKGGKLPGLYGGTSFETAKSCSGGRQDERDACFSARLMWRTNGMGEIYNYLPSAAYNQPGYCTTPPWSTCNPTYGESIGRGAFTFPTGQWTTLAIRLKLNDANVPNGEQELFVNGNSVLKLTDLMISVNSETKIYGIMAQTFFGGSDDSWASPIDQSAWFKDWSLAVLA